MQKDERLFPVGSYYIGYKHNQNVGQLFGFGEWEMKARTPEGKYLYERIS